MRHGPHGYYTTGRPTRSTLYEVDTCPKHETPLVFADVDVMYGLGYLAPAGYAEVRRAEFPYARGLIDGGSCTPDTDRLVMRVDRCEACTEAERAWLARGE